MGTGFMLDWKWVFPINPSNPSPNRPHSSSLKGKEVSFESLRTSTVSFIPEGSDTWAKDSFTENICTLGPLQSIETSFATTSAKMSIGDKKAYEGFPNDFKNVSMPILENNSAYRASSPSNEATHFSLLMENLRIIEETFDNFDMVRLERDIMIEIGRLGALKLFHACLSRTHKALDAPDKSFSLTKYQKIGLIDSSKKNHIFRVIVTSGKKNQRKSKRERATKHASKMCSFSLSAKPVCYASLSLKNASSAKSRRLTIARSEMEMARGVKEVTKLERIRTSLEVRIGRCTSLACWASEAGINEKVLVQRLQFGWYCREKLLKSTRSLVLYLSRNYRGHGIKLEDLLQAGNLGVLQGAERFDHTRGYRFSTYVQYWIRKSMSLLLARHSKGIKIPATMSNVINQIRKAQRSFYKKYGKYPQDEEMAMFTGFSLANIILAKKCSRVVNSIDQKIGVHPAINFKEIIPDKTIETPEETVMKEHLRKEIHELLEGLHPREKQVLIQRFGLKDGICKSLEEIGTLFKVSKEWIRKIEKTALAKVGKEEVKNTLKNYIVL